MGIARASWAVVALCLVGSGGWDHSVGADCTGLTGVAAAQCSLGNIQADGLTDVSAMPPAEVVVPQYSGSSGCADATCAGAPEAAYYTNDGDTSALDTAGITASTTNPDFLAVQQMHTDAAAWDPALTAPVMTADAVATSINSAPPPSSTIETCVDVTICTDVDSSPSVNLCQSPGVSEALCHVKVQAVNTFAVNDSFTGSSILSWCTDNELYLRARSPSPGVFVVEWADVKNARWDSEGNLVSGQAHRFCRDTQPGHSTAELWHLWFSWTWDSGATGDITVLSSSFVANFVGAVGPAGGCRSFKTSSISIADGVKYVIECPSASPPEQYGTLTLLGVDISASYQELIKTDGCAPYRTGVLAEEVCLDSAPRTYTDPLNGPYTMLPPTEAPFNGCWDKTEKWLNQAPGVDECLVFLDAGCTQTNSYCVSTTGTTCERYEKEFTCPSGSVCTNTATVSQCSSCGAPGSLVPFCTDLATPPNDELFLAATYLQLAEEVEDDWDPVTLSLFTGDSKDCRYDTFGSTLVNCCDADPARLLGACSASDIELAEDREADLTHYVGTHCVRELNLGFTSICIEKEQVYCSFNSKLARIVQEQGRPQIPRNWGDEDDPDCRGFTFEQFSALDWSLMDLSEFYTDVTASIDVGVTETEMQNKICLQLGSC
ncbi:MAG: conjugal transfer protein TraN [Nitrospirota bacterium]|nr:conjugal transfer protein TraN [Nitrospirota bacterium]